MSGVVRAKSGGPALSRRAFSPAPRKAKAVKSYACSRALKHRCVCFSFSLAKFVTYHHAMCCECRLRTQMKIRRTKMGLQTQRVRIGSKRPHAYSFTRDDIETKLQKMLKSSSYRLPTPSDGDDSEYFSSEEED